MIFLLLFLIYLFSIAIIYKDYLQGLFTRIIYKVCLLEGYLKGM